MKTLDLPLLKSGRTCALLALCALPFVISAVQAQGTAFTYQGRLNDSGSPANGNYDLQFIIHDAANGGNQLGGAVVVKPIPVSNRLFSVTLDFGAGIFTGPGRCIDSIKF